VIAADDGAAIDLGHLFISGEARNQGLLSISQTGTLDAEIASAAEAVEATVAIDAADPVAFLRSLHAAGGTIAWSHPERGPVES